LKSMDFMSDPLIEIIGLEYSSSALQGPQEKIDHIPRIGLWFLFLSP